jgi:prolyl-tRNA editing enzyme YbaK/EbsC (Cys-tRNA(Pro) deacylase)
MENLDELLKQHNCDYEWIHHPAAIHTVQDGADFFGIQPGQTAPTLILSSEKGFLAMILSGSRDHIDFDLLSQQLGFKIFGLAKRSEVKKATGFTTGAVAMVGHHLPCIFDTALLQYPYVYGGSGDEHCTLKIRPADLLKVNEILAQI